jgi:hypothetical protein
MVTRIAEWDRPHMALSKTSRQQVVYRRWHVASSLHAAAYASKPGDGGHPLALRFGGGFSVEHEQFQVRVHSSIGLPANLAHWTMAKPFLGSLWKQAQVVVAHRQAMYAGLLAAYGVAGHSCRYGSRTFLRSSSVHWRRTIVVTLPFSSRSVDGMPQPSSTFIATRLASFVMSEVQLEIGLPLRLTLTIQSARPWKNAVHSSPTFTVRHTPAVTRWAG